MVTSTGVPVQPYFDLIQVLKFIFRKWFFKMGLKMTKNGFENDNRVQICVFYTASDCHGVTETFDWYLVDESNPFFQVMSF